MGALEILFIIIIIEVNFPMQNECQQANKFMKIIASLSFWVKSKATIRSLEERKKQRKKQSYDSQVLNTSDKQKKTKLWQSSAEH